jgi:hypothetical protein
MTHKNEETDLGPIFDWFIDWAIVFLREHGGFPSSALVLTSRVEAEKLEAKGHTFEKLDDWAPAKGEDLIGLLVDMDDVSHETNYHRLLAIHAGEEIADALRMMEQIGKSSPNVEDVYGSIVRGYYRVSGAEPRDVLMEYMRTITSATRAHAVIAVLDSWYRESAPPDGFTGSYKDLPDSKEGLQCQLVTRSSVRLKSVGFRRDEGHERGEGPVVHVDVPRETHHAHGIMTEFFRPDEPQPGEEQPS